MTSDGIDQMEPLSPSDRAYLELGRSLTELARDQAAWSHETFGPASARGPVGPLKHLAKEAAEAADRPDDISEYADILILLLDATWRRGLVPEDIVGAALAKMAENRAREWPPFDPSKADEPVEHVRD